MKQIFHQNIIMFFLGICLGIVISMFEIPNLSNLPMCLSSEKYNENLHGFLRELEDPSSQKKTKSSHVVIPNIQRKNKDTKEKVTRPRYYASELGIKKEVFMAVVSKKSSLASYGTAVNQTLGSYADKLVFFLDGTESMKLNLQLPVVGFKSSKPSLKMLRVLSYVIENFVEDYNYFYFLTDHTYLDGENFKTLLSHASVSLNLYVGVKRLGEKFCSLDSGVLLSRSILQEIKKNWSLCTQNAESPSLGQSLGKCVFSVTQDDCLSTIKGADYKSVDYKEMKIRQTESALGNIITVSSLPDSEAFYSLRKISLQRSMKADVSSIRMLQKLIDRIPGVKSQWPTGSYPSCRPETRHDVIPWDYVYDTASLEPDSSPDVKSTQYWDIMNAVNSSVQYVLSSNINLVFKKLHFGYRKFDKTRGTDYMFELEFTRSDGTHLIKRVDVFRSLALPELVPVPFVTESSHIFLILFANEENSANWISFIKRLEKNAEMNQLTLSFLLHYVVKNPQIDPYKDLKAAISAFSSKYYGQQSRASWKVIVSPDAPTPIEVADMALKRLEKSSLVFMTQPKAYVDSSLLNKIRLNAIQGWQVYSLIPFTAYHPTFSDQNKITISGSNGWYDVYNQDSLAFYVSDYILARKSMKGKKEKHSESSLNIMNLFLKQSSLHILRSPDSSFVLPYAAINCRKNDSVCFKRKMYSFGTITQLSKAVQDYRDKNIVN